MPRPQFSLKTLLWLMVVVSAFCAGTSVQRRLDKPKHVSFQAGSGLCIETVETRDGTRWMKVVGTTTKPTANH